MRYLNYDGTPERFLERSLKINLCQLLILFSKKIERGSAILDAFYIKSLYPNNSLEGSWSDGRLRGKFNTLKPHENGVPQDKVPRMFSNKGGTPLEPFTEAYPEYGKGGVKSLIAEKKIVIFDEVKILPEE